MSEAGQSGPRTDRRMWLAIAGPMLAYPLAGVDPLLLNLNLGAVGRGLDVPSSQLGLLAGASTMVVAATVLAVGNLGDRFGLRKMMLAGLGGTIVCGLLSAAAPNYGVLLGVRVAQGVALAALLGVSMALVAATVPDPKRPLAIGVVMAVYTVMYGLAPLLGGWVVSQTGWRALFVVTLPIAVVALFLTWRFAPEPSRPDAMKLDVWGVVFFGVVLLGLVAGIGSARNGFALPTTWVPLLMSVLSLALLIRRERRVEHPALDLRLFARRTFTVAVLATLATNIFASGLGTLLGQLGTYILGLSASAVGLLYVPGTILVATASVMAGRFVARWGTRPVLVTGLTVVCMSGVVLAVTASPTMAVAVLVLGIWLDNLGGFVSGTASADAILAEAPVGRTGSVAAVQPAAGMSGFALGPTLVIVLLQVFFRNNLVSDAAAHNVAAAQARSDVEAAAAAMASAPGGSPTPVAILPDGLTLGLDYTEAFQVVMLVLTALVVAVAVLGVVLMRNEGRVAHSSASSP